MCRITGAGHLACGRHQVVGEGAGQERCRRRRRRTPRISAAPRPGRSRRGSARRPCRDAGCVPQSCMVTYRSMRTCAGVAVDLDAAEVEDEAVAERGVDLVVFGRARVSSGGRPEGGLAHGRVVPPAASAGRPVAGARRRGAKGSRVVGVAARARPCRRRRPDHRRGTLSCAAAMRASLSRSRVAARCAAPATAAAKRLE